MIYAALRQHVESALAGRQGDGLLAQRLQALCAAQAVTPPPEWIAQSMEQLRAYVRGTPDLLERCAVAAQQAGSGAEILPILQVSAQYFLAPQDAIPDHLGLYGLLDDAYLAQSTLEHVSQLHLQYTGMPLLGQSLAGANGIVRNIIGEPVASQLDAVVTQTIQSALMRHQVQQLHGMSAPLELNDPTGGPGAWGGCIEDEMARIGAKLGISF